MFKFSNYFSREGRLATHINIIGRNRIDKIFNKILFNVNVVLSGCAAGFFFWILTAYIKSILLDHYRLNLNTWANLFYNPKDAAFFNYAVLCVGMALYGLVYYVRTQRNSVGYVRKKLRTLGNQFPLVLLVSSVLFIVLGNRHWEISHRLLISLYLLFILFVPLELDQIKKVDNGFNKLLVKAKYIFNNLFLLCRNCFVFHKSKILLLLTFALLLAISVEPLRVIKGPVYVMNEYKNIYSDTKINGVYINNKTFLEAIEHDEFLVDEFVKANELEYAHQIFTRGPFNHIGHILNPLNEYISGKAPADVYMQYGQGNTMLYKWTMDLFGGLSLDNFYKCYISYIIYSLLFLGLLLYLFKDPLFVLSSFAVYAISFFLNRYTAFILAPGIMPTIHLFDTTVFLLLLLYFRRNNPICLLAAIVLAVFSIYMNHQFGLVLLVSLMAATLPYIWETKQGRERYILLAILVLLTPLMLTAPFFKTPANTNSTLHYFLLGYLSYRPNPEVVFLTIVYLVVSYHFLFLIRKQTHYLKNAFIFMFIYSQGLLAYFYWSGLISHLFPLLPFIGLELILMLFITRELVVKTRKAHTALNIGMMIITVLLVLSSIYAIAEFYKSKKVHTRNYEQHRVYHWNFDRAKIVTTINPKPFQESIALIQKYSPLENSGIYILSVYDNVLPFLAKRYSLMPFFEMQSFVFTSKERTEAINRLMSQKPEYLFVENEIDVKQPDLWEPYFNYPNINKERKSNQERRLELGKIFTAVEEDYEKIEEGVLLSVYKSKTPEMAPDKR